MVIPFTYVTSEKNPTNVNTCKGPPNLLDLASLEWFEGCGGGLGETRKISKSFGTLGELHQVRRSWEE